MKSNRLAYPRKFEYSKHVRIGNWFEENSSYRKSNFKHVSHYSEQYVPKSFTNSDHSSTLWDHKIKEEDTSFFPRNTTTASPNYFENYCTLFHLSYNHFPTLDRRAGKPLGWKPPDSINTYGNITNYGITNPKREEWAYDKHPKPYTSYTVDFAPPDHAAYLFTRWTRLTAVPMKYGKDYKQYSTEHPRFHDRNPVTWNVKKTQKVLC